MLVHTLVEEVYICSTYSWYKERVNASRKIIMRLLSPLRQAV